MLHSEGHHQLAHFITTLLSCTLSKKPDQLWLQINPIQYPLLYIFPPVLRDCALDLRWFINRPLFPLTSREQRAFHSDSPPHPLHHHQINPPHSTKYLQPVRDCADVCLRVGHVCCASSTEDMLLPSICCAPPSNNPTAPPLACHRWTMAQELLIKEHVRTAPSCHLCESWHLTLPPPSLCSRQSKMLLANTRESTKWTNSLHRRRPDVGSWAAWSLCHAWTLKWVLKRELYSFSSKMWMQTRSYYEQ